MNKNIVIAIIFIILAVGGYFIYQSMNTAQVSPSNNQESQTNSQNEPSNNEPGIDIEVIIPKTHEVTYTDSGYSPNELTVKVGDTVTYKNQSSGGMWVASAMHPTHVVYSGTSLQEHCPDTANTSFDACKSSQTGESWSFTFTKIGTWGYHNHGKSTAFGKIIVE